MFLAMMIWFTQRRRSRYVAMQARQAVLWQTLGHIVVFLVIGLLVITVILAVGGSDAEGIVGAIAGGSMVGSVILLFLIPVGATIFFFTSSIIGAIASLFGRHYTYPLIGRLAHRSVNPAADVKRLPAPRAVAHPRRTRIR
jgi:uncharacterized Tic20 family protein